MRKNFILRLVFLTAVAFSLHSCMHDDLTNPQQEKSLPASSFKVFQKDSNGKEPDYAHGFAALYWKYQEIHPQFKQSVSKNLKESKPAVLFSLASEPLILDDGSRVVIYPVVANNRITGLAAGVLNHEENYVSYQMVSETTEGYENMISAFRLRFSMLPKDVLMRVGGNGSGCNDTSGCGETGSTQIETIVIRPKPRTIQWGGSGDGSEPWGNEPDGPPGGGCEGFGDCGGSTGNNPSAPEPPQNPCEKTKAIISKPQITDSLNALKAHAQTNTKKERGFQELKSGTLVQGNVNGNNLLEFGVGQNSLGTVHSHQPGTIGILAPQDVMTFLHIVRAQDANGLGNAYSGTVSSSGTYFINFTGTASDLPPAMTDVQEAAYVAGLVKNYKQDYFDLLRQEGKKSHQNLSNAGLEKLFFKLLNKIGLSGKVTLIKENNGNTSTIEKDASGNPIPNPC